MKKTSPFHNVLLCYWVVLIVSCSPVETSTIENDVLLAKVFNKSLYLSELDGMIPEGISSEDSTSIIHAEVERWAREVLLLQEAEKNIPKDLNIDELVRDYRASLIRHNYEKIFVEVKLDSLVTQAELNNYYEKNKEQYQLESSIFRCHLIKIPLDAPNLEEVRTWWRSNEEESFNQMKEYSEKHAEYFSLGDSIWLTLEDVRVHMPNGTSVFPNQDMTQSDDKYLYFLKVMEKRSQKEIAPLAFIQEQAKKVILHQRKRKILEENKEDIYERETRRKNVKIFVK